MARKLKALTPTQKELLRAHGLKLHEWRVTQDLMYSMIVQHRITGEFRVIEKKVGR